MFSLPVVLRRRPKSGRKLQLIVTAALYTLTITVLFRSYSLLDGHFSDLKISNAMVAACNTAKKEERLLLVLRIPVHLEETRNFVRSRVKNQTEYCKMDVVFLFGSFHGPKATYWGEILRRESQQYGDLMELPVYSNNQLPDLDTVESVKKWLTATDCKVYSDVAFGTFVLPDNKKIDTVTRINVREDRLTKDECLKFHKYNLKSAQFSAHYFLPPPIKHLDQHNFNDSKELGQYRFRYQGSVVAAHDYRYLKGRDMVCANVAGKQLLSIIAVHSSAFNFLNRKLIRASWGSQQVMKEHNSLLVFFLGRLPMASNHTADERKLEAEYAKYNDIVQEDYQENYKNMTIKQIGVLKFLSTYCSDVEYSFLFKTDDDVIIDMKSVANYMNSLTVRGLHLTRTIFCFHLNEPTILVPRNQSSKWFVSRTEFPMDVYPAYCSGAGYLIPKILIPLMYEAALHIEPFWVDDTHISGSVLKAIGDVALLQIPKQYPLATHTDKAHPQDVAGKFIIHVKQNLELFPTFWNNFQRSTT